MTPSVRELVVSVPSPRRDHREYQPAALGEEILIDVQVVITDIGRRVRHIELNWATTAGFEVDEDRATRGVEDVSRMRLAVK